MFNTKIFSEHIKDIRKELDMTQYEFCHLLHISQQSLSAYENGKMLPSLEIAQRIAIIGNVSLDWLSGLSSINHLNTEPVSAPQLFNTLVNLVSCPIPNIEITIKNDTPSDKSESRAIINIVADSLLGESVLELDKNLELVRQSILTDELFQIWIRNRYQKILTSTLGC